MKYIYVIIKRTIILIINKSNILVGGQAVIEGVMMRVPVVYATAVRTSNGEIIYKRYPFESIVNRKKYFNIPIIRGAIHLFESLKIGMKTLQWSADMAMAEELSSKNKILDIFLNIIAFLFAIGLFVAIPIILAEYISKNKFNPFYFNFISGSVRITLFLLYLLLISKLKDIKRLFLYHGAEHRTVYTFEKGHPLTVVETKNFSTLHPRCGTSFIFIVMMVAIISFGIFDSILLFFIDVLNPYKRILFHLILLPVVAGIGYEILKISAKHRNFILFKILSQPGLWLQLITTKVPTDEQTEVSIKALEVAFGEDIEDYLGKEFVAEAIS